MFPSSVTVRLDYPLLLFSYSLVSQLPQADMPLSSAFMIGLSSLCITTIWKVFILPLPVSSHNVSEYLRMASSICPKKSWLFGPDEQRLCAHHPVCPYTPSTVSSLGKVTKNGPLNVSLHYSKLPGCLSFLLCSAWEAEQSWWLLPLAELSTYGLGGGFGLRRLHMQMGHHGLQALFVFCKLAGRKCFVILWLQIWAWFYHCMTLHPKWYISQIKWWHHHTWQHRFHCLIIVKSIRPLPNSK